jgi:VanZ family protein
MKIVRYWIPVITWMCVIFFFSSRQKVVVSEDNQLNFLFFKTLHVLEYYMLYFLSFRAVKYTWRNHPKGMWCIVAFAITILYAVTDEVHQLFVPTREGRLRDVIIDAGGAALSFLTLWIILPKLPAKLLKSVRHWQLL